MNSVNFNVVTPNVNYLRLSDESTDKQTEQVSFKCKNFRYRKEGLKELKKSLDVIDFFRNFGLLFKNIGKKSKEVTNQQKVTDFASDAANYFDYKKRGRNIEAEIYKERMRKFLEDN